MYPDRLVPGSGAAETARVILELVLRSATASELALRYLDVSEEAASAEVDEAEAEPEALLKAETSLL